MKEWYERFFAALKSWPVGAVLALSASANIYLALWCRQLTEKAESRLEMVIDAKDESIRIKAREVERIEQEVRDLKKRMESLTPPSS
jgi:hypothetical protein